MAAQYARVGVVVNRSTMSAQGQAISDAQDATQRLLGAMFDGTPLDARVDFASLSHEAIDLMVGTLQTGSPLRDLTFSNLSVAGAESVARALVAGFVAGEPIRQVAKRVDLERNMTHARALTIARTETLRTLRESSLLVMSRNSHLLQGWRWSARFDGHTCGVCVALQGSLHDTLEPMDTHPNCRCSPVPQTKSWEDLGYPGIPDTSPELPTADRWLKMMRDKDLVRAFGPSRAALIRDGYLRPQDLVSHVDRGRWGKQPTLTSVAMAQRIAMDRGWKPKAPTEVKPPDQPYIGKGASIGNLEAWAHQQFPHLATVNLNGLDPSVVAPALKELARLHERYPGVFSRVETLRVAQAGEGKGSEWAHTYLQGKELVLYPRAWRDSAKLLGELRLSQVPIGASGRSFHPTGMDTPESIVQHEFGHLMDGYLRGYGSVPAGTMLHSLSLLPSGLTGTWNQGTWADVINLVTTKFRGSRNISGYAAENYQEKFAETWSAQFSPDRATATNTWTERLRLLADVIHSTQPTTATPTFIGPGGKRLSQAQVKANDATLQRELDALAKRLGFASYRDMGGEPL